MVAAGVYLVARLMPMFELAPVVLVTIASVGLFTFLFSAGTIALVVNDIKRVLAYSTISHLGLMMLSLGAGGVGAALFHLVAHGVSKALLFLGAGSVMHAMEDETDIRRMGSLRHRMPLTAWTFVIGAASLAGVIPLAGFFTKDEMLLHILEHRHPVFIVLALAGVALSAMYTARVTFATFFGAPRSDHSGVRESPASMTLPLALLAALAATVGLLAFGGGEGFGGFAAFIEGHGKFRLVPWLSVASLALASVGIWVGWAAYVQGTLSPSRLIERFPKLHRVMAEKYYVDKVYQWAIDRLVLAFGRLVAVFDRVVVNDTAVDGSAETVRSSGIQLRYIQTGRIYNYGLAMALGVVVVAVVWWVALG